MPASTSSTPPTPIRKANRRLSRCANRRATLEPTGRRMAHRRYRKDRALPESRRRSRLPAGFDMSKPENQRKLDAADAHAQLAVNAGLSLSHLALAFVM